MKPPRTPGRVETPEEVAENHRRHTAARETTTIVPGFTTTHLDDDNRCPACQADLSAGTGKVQPRPNDVSICFKCGEILLFGNYVLDADGHLLFDESLKPRKPTATEMIELQLSPQWYAVESLARRIRERKDSQGGSAARK